MRTLVLTNHQSPGDVVCMTAALRDLNLNHPNKFRIGVDTTAQPLWDHNPYVDQSLLADRSVPRIKAEYPLVHQSNNGPYHFTEGFTDHLEEILDVRIRRRLCRGDIHLSLNEKAEVCPVGDAPFWILVNGGKMDFTAKWWSPLRMLEVVRALPTHRFVQVGELHHKHWVLDEPNVVNMLGRTDVRGIVKLTYHAAGVICPVTFLMHLAAAVPVKSNSRFKNRPCVVIAGGREPMRWEAYTSHAYLHTCGTLRCCDEGGCWKSRVLPLNDSDKQKDASVCLQPVTSSDGITLPKCLDMITANHVIEAIKRYEQS